METLRLVNYLMNYPDLLEEALEDPTLSNIESCIVRALDEQGVELDNIQWKNVDTVLLREMIYSLRERG